MGAVPTQSSVVVDLFLECVDAIRNHVLIHRTSNRDKEFALQDWFEDRLTGLGHHFDRPRRNKYPDYTMVNFLEGFEVKGVTYGTRSTNFDCNSQMPKGTSKGRQVYYVFARYPKAGGTYYPIIDLMMFHGSLLNAASGYQHKNKSFRGFGSFGDILVRDRKMYVAPNPFALTTGTAATCTLILPASFPPDQRLVVVGHIDRAEVAQVVVKYDFDLRTNQMNLTYSPNLTGGTVHSFVAYRPPSLPNTAVSLAAGHTSTANGANAVIDDDEVDGL